MLYCCANCFLNDSIKKYIYSNHEYLGDCDYCKSNGVEVIPVGSLGIHLCECIKNAYEDPEDGSGAMWDSEDGEYLGPDGKGATIYSVREILTEKECIFAQNTQESSLLEDLFNNLYLDREIKNGVDYRYSDVDSPCLVLKDDLYGIDNIRAYSAWTTFKHINNHYSRFFEAGDGDFRKQCLEKINMYLYESIRDIEPGEILYRLREQDDTLSDIHTIEVNRHMGPPPAKFAKTNRMSPAGIPYLYLASDVGTTIKECRINAGKIAVCAEFASTKSLQIVDLSEVPLYYAKSIFDEEYDHDDNWVCEFLKGFIEEISKPVDDDKMDHSYEYAATQVVAEFFRNVKHFDGICFKSSVGEGKNYVFFLGPSSRDYKDAYPYPFGDVYLGQGLPVLDSFNDFFAITKLDLIRVLQEGTYKILNTKIC